MFEDGKADRLPNPVCGRPVCLPKTIDHTVGATLHDFANAYDTRSIASGRPFVRAPRGFALELPSSSTGEDAVSKPQRLEKGFLFPAPGRIRKKASVADAFPLQANLPPVSADGFLIQPADSTMMIGRTHGCEGEYFYSLSGTARMLRRPPAYVCRRRTSPSNFSTTS